MALAQELQRKGYKVCFIVSECPDTLLKKLEVERFTVSKIFSKSGSANDVEETVNLAKNENALWVIADGYVFTEIFQKEIKNAKHRLLLVDDYGHCNEYYSDIILNQNLHAGSYFYTRRQSFTKLLLGPQFLLLRKQFLPYMGWKRQNPKVATKLLVTLGGSDPDNTTLKVIKAIKKSNLKLQVKLVVGEANPHVETLEKEIFRSSNLEILRNAENMAELMVWADIVITSGGVTSWEACFMGLSDIIIYCVENQKPVAVSLDKVGAAINLGYNRELDEDKLVLTIKSLADDFELRNRMSEKGKMLVDGKGAERVVHCMEGLFLRKPQMEDCHFVWELSNSRSVRDISFSKEQIPWERHRDWFEKTINDRNSFFCIVETADGKRAGQIRFRIDGTDATVSISLVPDFRGKGYGSTLIAESSEELFRTTNVKNIHAYIKPENIASIKSFLKGGYSQDAPDSFALRNNALHLIMKRSELQ
ncbi:MAG TPA: UDP-2,4-diacetamido-2,4,6-trideoxy-beta-L-altropyranose hydrolase, partial [Victivallales bacterium]|nr:UDP-2,4-diacetamido-2,4,6-trideoxy-beta-L-altropyranose hydrolase [Victivallales bacterium]